MSTIDLTGKLKELLMRCDYNEVFSLKVAKQLAPEIEKMRGSSFADRSWTSDHPAFQIMTEEARAKLAKNPDCYAKPAG